MALDEPFGADVLGRDYLRPSPLFPIEQLIGPSGASPSTQPAGLNVSVAPPSAAPSLAPDAAPGAAWANALAPPANSGGLFGPNAGRVMAALGAGLSSAGANWNKPAAAAFASGAGAALQGGEQWAQQQQNARLKALHAAIAAWKGGDMTGYQQALANFAAAKPQPNRAAPGLTQVLAQARDAIARGAPREAVIQRLRENNYDPSGL